MCAHLYIAVKIVVSKKVVRFRIIIENKSRTKKKKKVSRKSLEKIDIHCE